MALTDKKIKAISFYNVLFISLIKVKYPTTSFPGDKRQDIETELETCDLKSDSLEPPKTSVRDENLSIAQMVARYPHCSKTTCKNMYLMDTEKVRSYVKGI